MKLTTRGRYALQALLDLAQHSEGRAVRLQDISTRQGISLFYLEQLFRQMRQVGIVKSVRGPGGGYLLSTLPESLKVLDILDSVKELTNYANRTSDEVSSTLEMQKLEAYLTELDSVVTKMLNKSLQDMLNK